MQHSMTDAPVGANHDTIQGLREAADWLEQHPELPKAHAAVYMWASRLDVPDSREALTTVAAALGDRATETVEHGDVVIRGEFAAVKVRAHAPLRDVAGLPVVITPAYEPIIQQTPPVTAEEDEAWKERER